MRNYIKVISFTIIFLIICFITYFFGIYKDIEYAIVIDKYKSKPISMKVWSGGNYGIKVIPSSYNLVLKYKADTFSIQVDAPTYNKTNISDKYIFEEVYR